MTLQVFFLDGTSRIYNDVCELYASPEDQAADLHIGRGGRNVSVPYLLTLREVVRIESL